MTIMIEKLHRKFTCIRVLNPIGKDCIDTTVIGEKQLVTENTCINSKLESIKIA